MLKVGDVLWEFRRDSYFVGEISHLSVVVMGFSNKDQFYLINTNGIIGEDQVIFIPVIEDLNTLVKVPYYSEPIYYTVSESVAVNYIRDRFNETDNQRNLQ